MSKKRTLRRGIVEILESRRVFSASGWWMEDSGQQPGEFASATAFGDMDGDGDLDAVVDQRNDLAVWKNDGNGQLTEFSVGDSSAILDIKLGDLDGDGDVDVVVARGTPPSGRVPNQVWLNDGDGNLRDSGQRLGREATSEVHLADVDNDGDLDIVDANAVGWNKVWMNDGQGQFTDSGQELIASQDTFSVALGDLDGDGDLDAYYGRGFRSRIDRVFLNDGHGNFTDSSQQLGSRWANSVRLGDLDQDGDLDAFVANGDQHGTSQSNEVWINDGLGRFSNSGQNLGRALSMGVELGDLDGDGDLDAFVANGLLSIRQANKIWLNDSAGNFFDSEMELGRPLGTRDISLGDIDGDNDLDALIGQHVQDNELWLNRKCIPGDVNFDGVFNSTDLIQVFQAGEYEDSISNNSTYGEGDWNGDGEFNSSDLVLAFQSGAYSAAALPRNLAVVQERHFVFDRESSEKPAWEIDPDSVDSMFESADELA